MVKQEHQWSSLLADLSSDNWRDGGRNLNFDQGDPFQETHIMRWITKTKIILLATWLIFSFPLIVETNKILSNDFFSG